MIGVPTAWIAGGTLVAGLGAGFWVGHEMGAARYLDGLHAGIKSQQKISDAEIARLIAQSRADAAVAVQTATQAILDKEKARHESEAHQRALQAQEAAHVASTVADLRRRLRVATSRPVASGPGALSSTLSASPGLTASPDAERNLLKAGRGILRFAEAAETEAGRYRVCHRWVYSDPQVRSE